MSAREINVSTINLEGGGGAEPAKLQSKTIVVEENKTETVTPDSGFDGLSDVTVEVNVPIKEGVDMSKGIRFRGSTFAEIDSLNTYNWDKVVNCEGMFHTCSKLMTMPELNTDNATNMNSMFYSCSNLVSIPGLNTSSVTNMYNLFTDCGKLTSIPQLNTSSVTNMSNAFSGCLSLTTIPQLDTSRTTNMNNMFRNCSKLASIPQLDANKVTNMGYILYNCSQLTDLGGFLNASVNFSLSQSNKLTVESLMNVINNLKDMTGATAPTLTLGRTNLAKLTDDQKAVATNKNWLLA